MNLKYTYLFFISILLIQCKTNTSNEKKILETEHKVTKEIDHSNSLKSIEQQIIENPESPNGYTKRSYYYSKNGDLKRAIDDINRALTLTPDVPDLNFTKAELLFNQAGKNLNALLYDQSEIYLNNTLKLDSTFVKAHILKAKINIGRKAPEEAFKSISNAIKISPTLSEPYALKGFIYQRLGNTLLSQSSYQTALEMDANNYDANVGLGFTYSMDTNASAIIYFDAASRLSPLAIEPIRNKALLLRNLGRIEEAKTTFIQLLAIDSTFEEAYYNIGVCTIESYRDNFDKNTKDSIINNAIQNFEKAVDLNPNYMLALYNLGYSYEFTGDKKKALEFYKRAIDIEPDFELVNDALRRF